MLRRLAAGAGRRLAAWRAVSARWNGTTGRAETEIVARLAAELGASLDLDAVLARVADAARRLCAADVVRIALRSSDGGGMTYRFLGGTRAAGNENVRLVPGPGLVGRALATGRPYRTAEAADDPATHPDYRHFIEAESVRTAMAVPIGAAERPDGVLYVARRTPRPFTDADEGTAVRLAAYAAIALRNAALFRDADVARQRAEAATADAAVLAEASRILASSLDYVRTVDGVLRLIVPRLGDWAELYLASPSSDNHRLGPACADPAAAAAAETIRQSAPTVRWRDVEDPVAKAQADGEPLVLPVIPDGWLDAHLDGPAYLDLLRSVAPTSLLLVPLRVRGRSIGSLLCVATRSARKYTAGDVALARDLAGRIATAIDTARLVHRADEARAAAERAERRASFLNEAGVLLGSSLDYEQTLAEVTRLIVPGLADMCAVDMVDEQRIRRLAVAHRDAAKEPIVREIRDRYGFRADAPSGVPHVLRTGEAVFVPRVMDAQLREASSAPEQLELLRSLGMRAWIIVPLLARGRILGALTLVMADSGRAFAAADVELAQDLARRAATAIDNAHLYREAQAANQAKDEFLTTLSHELRTPLNSVYGWARMLRTGTMDPAATSRALEVIERSAQAQVQLIEDLLDISRITTGKLRLETRRIDPATVVRAALDVVGPALEAKHLELRTSLDSSAGPVMGDPDRLQQVVWNLLTNAVKFTPAGGRVDVSLLGRESHVEIVVSDTGGGIDPAFLPHVFERFRQGDSTTTRAQRGLGIGLALVHHLVELHGGHVSAHSDGAGRGATFVVRLQQAPVED